DTALCLAIDSGALEAFRLLLARAQRAALSAHCRGGLPPIARAAKSGNADLVAALLAGGADPNARGSDGTTALMWAANSAAIDVVRLLLERGADTELVAEDGWTARKAAEMIGYEDIVQLLEER